MIDDDHPLAGFEQEDKERERAERAPRGPLRLPGLPGLPRVRAGTLVAAVLVSLASGIVVGALAMACGSP